MQRSRNRTSSRLGLAAGISALSLFVMAGQARPVDADRTEDAAHEHDHGLPNFDIRQTQNELPAEAARASLDRLVTSEAWANRTKALERLRLQIPDLRCDDHHLFGTPHFLRSTSRALTQAAKGEPREIVESYLLANADLFELDAKTVQDAALVRDADTHGLMRHLTLQQRIDGIELYGSILRTTLTSRGELLNIGGSFVPRPVGGWNIPQARLSAEDALRAAAASVDAPIVNPIQPGKPEGSNEKTVWSVGEELDHWLPVTTRRTYFPMTREDVRPAFVVVVPTKGAGHTYEIVIDATDGGVLWRQNYLACDTTEPVTYRVYASDSPAPGSPGRSTPDGWQAPFVARSLITVMPDDIRAFSPDGWIPDGGSTTTGNNVDAYLDRDGSANNPDPNGRPVSASRVFDLPIVVDANNMPTGAPTDYSMASVTQGFYLANRYHDILYRLGFNEQAANFQTNNFGLGGAGNDRVLMEMQDGSGTNNANFSTPADGSSGRCQMYIFTGTTPDRDGGLDAEIVYHELTHGTSNRCHEITLTGTQARSMGEGWGDFYGITLNAESGDDFNAVYTTGGHTTYLLWAGYTNNYYFGIRRFPYSTDMLKNPQTFADIATASQSYPAEVPRNTNVGNTATEVHNAGEVWCMALVECRAALAADEGFAANDTIMQLVLDGMKLAPGNPNFLQQRDAILQSDLVRYGGAHQGRLWQAFARRGMGYSATSPTGGSTVGIVEAYDVPQRVTFSYPDGLPEQLQPGQAATFRVQLTPEMLTLTPDSGRLFIAFNGGAFSPVDMTPTGPNEYTATIPASDCFTNLSYYVQVGTSAGNRTDPSTAPASSFASLVYSSVFQPVYWDMETAAGWTVGPNTATTGIWERADPQGTTAQPEDDTTPAPGVACWVTGAAAGTAVGSFDIDGGYTYLTSPTFDLSASGDVRIEFDRWYNNNNTATYGDPWLVEISNNNGTTWTTFESIAVGAPNQPGWVRVSRLLSSTGLAGTNQMKMRFRAEDLPTASIVEAAIDEFRVFRYECVPPVSCDPDVNCDGVPDQGDVACIILAVAGDMSCFCQADPDFNHDGVPDQGDVGDLILTVAGAPCP